MTRMRKTLEWNVPQQFILKITLLSSEPEIWRRVEVYNGLTLHDLHDVIQCVFEWDDSHPYDFAVPPGGKLTQKALHEAKRYTLLPPGYINPDDDLERPADKTIIGQIFTPECKQIIYEYDFGDSWKHLVKLEKRTERGDPNHIPLCLAGENAGPVDDIGGIYGYYQRVDDLENGDEEAIMWLGKNFDLTRFDLEAVNKRLQTAFKPVKKRPPKPRKDSD